MRMNPMPKVGILIALSAVMLCGCATTILDSSTDGGSGVTYYLPKALLPVQLADVDGNLYLTVDKPQFVADLNYRYILNYVPDAAASDTLELAVDPATSLLQSASSTADDKTGELVVAMARSAATLAQLVAQSAPADSDKVVIFEELIDPTQNLSSVVQRMNRAAISHANARYAALQCGGTPAAEAKNSCAGYSTWRAGNPVAFAACRATAHECPVAPAAPALTEATPKNCGGGVCYRAAVPYRVEFSLSERNQYSTVVSLPNDTPTMMWQFPRTAFVKRINNAEFQNGMLKKVHVEKPSEAVEVAMLPVNVVKAVFESITGVFKFRVDLTNGEKGLVDAQKALLESQAALQKVMKPQSAGEASVLLSGSTNGRAVARVLPPVTPPTQQGQFPGTAVNQGSQGSGGAR